MDNHEAQINHNSSARILIVDDMPVNRTIMSSMLTSLGITCDLAGSGSECIEMCKKCTYDLILLDHRMPDMDGVDTLVVLKDIFRRTGAETPVICHTAEEGRNYINLYKAAGFADVLIKPADPGEVMVMLMTYLPNGGYVLPQDEERKNRVDRELESLPAWLKTVPKLDLKSGVEHCDTASGYLNALAVFAGSVQDKAADIKRFEDDENWPMYLLRVHSLKSVARLIGATSIADRAADLEFAGRHQEYALIHAGTSALLEEYNDMYSRLKKLIDMKELPKEEEKPKEKKPVANTRTKSFEKRKIILVSEDRGIVWKGITKALEEEDFDVISIKDTREEILEHRADSKLILYYPSEDADQTKVISAMLTEMCRDDNKILCLAGDPLDLKTALETHDKEYISSVYTRPIDLKKMAADMSDYHDMVSDIPRTRRILVIDDDTDFLAIIKGWLSETYHVECSRSGPSGLGYLDLKRPDLILLDYEMPGMNGDQVMQRIRSNPVNKRIPIIFLTGKNDREGIMKLLEQKPDGYLLKSMPKEELLDALERFFYYSAKKV